jgi:3'-phosphoadenosine 5'-phosphosulfate sulfotransferase (PAPS reductase)/FAD synthetase
MTQHGVPWPPPEILRLRDAGALFAVSHSGGKDSQAMMIRLRAILPPDQLLVVYADLGDVVWPGTLAHIEATIGAAPLLVVRAGTTLLAMVERRGRWPSPRHRQCTSDLKRGPIDTGVRRFLRAHPRFGGKVVSCIGLRAEESADRAARATLTAHRRECVAGRDWRIWLPIHDLDERAVFRTIADAGETPHWVYGAGMSRCSCSFCIMSSRRDLITAARLRPGLLDAYDTAERRTGQTMLMPRRGRAPMRLRDAVRD